VTVNPTDLADLLDRTRTQRGLPERIEDPAVLAAVAAVIVGAIAPHTAHEAVAS